MTSSTSAIDLTGIDLATVPAAHRARRLPTEVTVVFAAAPGKLDTPEGPVAFEEGDALLTGQAGDRWPVRRVRFLSTYEPVAAQAKSPPARYRRRMTIVWAHQYPHPFSVRIRDGQDVLHGKAGDWLVQHEPGQYGIVARDIFATTYAVDPD